MVDPSNTGDLFKFAQDALETMRNAVSKAQCAGIRSTLDGLSHSDAAAADVTPEVPTDTEYDSGY
jgi:hypothetical protein